MSVDDMQEMIDDLDFFALMVPLHAESSCEARKWLVTTIAEKITDLKQQIAAEGPSAAALEAYTNSEVRF